MRHVFRLCFSCLGHVHLNIPKVELDSGQISSTNGDLSCNIEPLQGYLLSGVSERHFFTDPESISICLVLLVGFCDNELKRGYNNWESVSFNDCEDFYAGLGKSLKAANFTSDVHSLSSFIVPAFLPEEFPEQLCLPNQRPRINRAKTQHGVSATLVAGRLRSVQKTSRVDSS